MLIGFDGLRSSARCTICVMARIALAMSSNHPANADARGDTVPCVGSWAHAGYWERYSEIELFSPSAQYAPSKTFLLALCVC